MNKIQKIAKRYKSILKIADLGDAKVPTTTIGPIGYDFRDQVASIINNHLSNMFAGLNLVSVTHDGQRYTATVRVVGAQDAGNLKQSLEDQFNQVASRKNQNLVGKVDFIVV